MAQLIADRYELEDVLGSGGMASVYCAHDTLLERKVALKILHEQHTEADEYVERFQREARAAAQLSHPGIVTVIDRGEADGRQFIVFEYVDGENLKTLVEREGPLPEREAIELVEDRATKAPAPDLAAAVIDAATERGLLLLKAGVYGNCIRVLCPLVIADAELDEALDVWEDALETFLSA